jgi:hypothetical protein
MGVDGCIGAQPVANLGPERGARAPGRDFHRRARVGHVDDPEVAPLLRMAGLREGDREQREHPAVHALDQVQFVDTTRAGPDIEEPQALGLPGIGHIPKVHTAQGVTATSLEPHRQEVAAEGGRLDCPHAHDLGRRARMLGQRTEQDRLRGVMQVDDAHSTAGTAAAAVRASGPGTDVGYLAVEPDISVQPTAAQIVVSDQVETHGPRRWRLR